jgi:hypothetical protein
MGQLHIFQKGQGGCDRGAFAKAVQIQLAALQREARQSNIPLSQAAGRSLAKGLARSLPADPDDRLLQLDRALRDHMRSTARDVQIIQELVIELARAFFLRLPDAVTDRDPVTLAAVDRRIEALLDAHVYRIRLLP